MSRYDTCVAILGLVLLCSSVQSAVDHNCTDYEVGKPITFQCKNANGEWGPAPKCQQTGEPMSFPYGMDSFIQCAWLVDTPEFYEFLRKLIDREENWNCRLLMAADHDFYIPFTIPIWGVAEDDHVHLNNHFNFVFHADHGKIIGVSAYPVQDRFQFVRLGTLITTHGVAKWFSHHTFRDMTPNSIMSTGSAFGSSWYYTLFLIVMWCIISLIFAAALFSYIYRFYLRPKVLRSMIKTD